MATTRLVSEAATEVCRGGAMFGIQTFFRQVARDESGQTLVMFALSSVALIGFVAMSVDVGRLVWARTQMQSAVDAAALAAAQSLPDKEEAYNQAQDYFDTNTESLQSQGSGPQLVISSPLAGNAIALEGEAHLPTIFASIFGIDSFHITAGAVAESMVVDAVVVLDRSGSMCWDSHGPNGQYISQVRLRNGINSQQTSFRVRKNNPLLPLSSYMLVGQVFRLESSYRSEWMEVTRLEEPDQVHVERAVRNPNNGQIYSATSHYPDRRPRGNTCQQAGAGPYFGWEYVKTGGQVFTDQMDSRYDRVGYAHFATRATLEMPMSNSLTHVKATIATSPDPTAFGKKDALTNIAHGFYLANREIVERGRSNAKHVIVLLSDGIANRYCAESTSVDCSSLGYDKPTARSRTLDQAGYAAEYGIIVYTIGYGANSDDALMQEIAERTGGKFFKAPTEDQLIVAFKEIASLTHVRLSE
ncbi:MAG TPA: VWA domain-containing protein [Dehalococcoidia bacterium]|nr:VWA domain-containing protein [Dehalococcoidia bacterium]